MDISCSCNIALSSVEHYIPPFLYILHQITFLLNEMHVCGTFHEQQRMSVKIHLASNTAI